MMMSANTNYCLDQTIDNVLVNMMGAQEVLGVISNQLLQQQQQGTMDVEVDNDFNNDSNNNNELVLLLNNLVNDVIGPMLQNMIVFIKEEKNNTSNKNVEQTTNTIKNSTCTHPTSGTKMTQETMTAATSSSSTTTATTTIVNKKQKIGDHQTTTTVLDPVTMSNNNCVVGISYDSEQQKYFGLEVIDSIKRKRRVEITDNAWVERTYPQVVYKIRNNNDNSNNSNPDGKRGAVGGESTVAVSADIVKTTNQFVMLPVGERSRNIIPSTNITWNPIIQYRKNIHDNRSSAFTSLASAFYYLGYQNESIDLISHCNNFYTTSTMYYDKFDRIFESIVQHIKESPNFKQFRKQYFIRRLKETYELNKQDVVQSKEIRLLLLHATPTNNNIHPDTSTITSTNTNTNSTNTMVANSDIVMAIVGNDWIFDSNCTNALPFNDEGLQDACGGCAKNSTLEIALRYGYYFELYTNNK